MPKRGSDANSRIFYDQLVSLGVSRPKATGAIKLEDRQVLIPFGGRTKLIGVAHTVFKNGGSWSYFRCPSDDEWLFNDRATRTVFLDAIRRANPQVMFIHSANDYLSDHRVAGQVAEDCRIPCSVPLVETRLPHCEKIPDVFYMDNAAGIDFQPEVWVDVTGVIEKKRRMLACHQSQDVWMRKAYDASIGELMERLSRMRGLAINAQQIRGPDRRGGRDDARGLA